MLLVSCKASQREAARTVRRADEICHQPWHIYDYYRNIKVIFRAASVLCDPGTVHQRDLQPCLCMCMCVVPVCERYRRRWQPINPFTVQVQISSGLRVPAAAAGCFQHHGQRHQQQHEIHQRVTLVLQLVITQRQKHWKAPKNINYIHVKGPFSHFLH